MKRFLLHDAFLLSRYVSVLFIWKNHARWHCYRSKLGNAVNDMRLITY